MNDGSDGRYAEQDEQLSALVDGELDRAGVAAACARWRDSAECRENWHNYQLIGDVLRSQDLASAVAHDAAFLAALRDRLADEPVVLAPSQPQPAADGSATVARRGPRLAAIGAIAAGFVVVVAGALTITGLPFQRSQGELVLADPGPALSVASADAAAGARNDIAQEVQPMVASGQLIRDARLDRYFAAHQQWSGSAMLGGHATYLRQSPRDGSTR